jgi:uncharacterized repeat protein (TIGR02543 family)
MKKSHGLINLILCAAVVIFMAACDSSGGCGGDGGDTPTTNYTLTIGVSGNGQTDPAAGTHTYAQGTSVSITALAGGGATFAGWAGAATGTANPVTITMNANQTLTATFVEGDDGQDDAAYDLPDQCTGTCNAATPVYPTILDNGGLGNVTMYTTEASNGGACNYGVTDVMYFAAMSVNVVPGDGQGQWQGGSICGQCAEVTTVTSQGPKKVVVRIMDKCPDGDCGIDLGGAAPAQVMVNGFGRYDGSWRFVSCEGHPEVSDGPPSLDVLQGSNLWWSRVHVRNGKGAVASIAWEDTQSSAGGVFPFATNPENAYEVPQTEVLQSAMTSLLITVQYVDGSTATVTLAPQQLGAASASYPLD